MNIKNIKEVEKKLLPKFVDNYIKSNKNLLKSYKETFNGSIYKNDKEAKEQALKLINSEEFREAYIEVHKDLRDVYKTEISNAFNFLLKVINEETFTEHSSFFDIETKKVINYQAKKSINMKDKLKATELILKTYNYLSNVQQNTQEQSQKTEFEIIDDIIDGVIENEE